VTNVLASSSASFVFFNSFSAAFSLSRKSSSFKLLNVSYIVSDAVSERNNLLLALVAPITIAVIPTVFFLLIGINK
jgi:hypothetical protein